MASFYPEFSIIVPTRNRSDSLRNCLNALAAMTYPKGRYEVIVVNDGGPFLDERDLRPPPSPLMNLRVLNQAHGGPASARNTGALNAQGRHLAFTDDDCVPSRNWLRMLAAKIIGNDRCVLGGRTLNMLPQNHYSSASQMMVDYLYGVMNVGNERARFLASNNLAVPRERFLAMGGFDTGFTRAAGEDRDFCRRWVERGYSMVYVPEAIVFHAHELGFRSYLRQHFAYGQGALRYHFGGSGKPSCGVGSLAFYWNLILFPLRQREIPGKYRLTFLMALSQAATAAGFVAGLWSAVGEVFFAAMKRGSGKKAPP